MLLLFAFIALVLLLTPLGIGNLRKTFGYQPPPLFEDDLEEVEVEDGP